MVNISVAIAMVDLIVMTNPITNVLRACVDSSWKLFVLKKCVEMKCYNVRIPPSIGQTSHIIFSIFKD